MFRDILLYGSGLDILCMAVFFLALAAVIVCLFQHFTQWQRNRTAPRLIVGADVISKRSERNADHGDEPPANGCYFVTFQVEGGDRMELRLPGRDFLRIAEGDFGRLTFQGSRYITFVPEGSAA